VFLAALGAWSCRRHSLGSRGDAAAVIVVGPHKVQDGKGAPQVVEQEPNDSPEQAQPLAVNSERPMVSIEGSLSGPGGATSKDVDVFKLRVPPGRTAPQQSTREQDSGQPEDPRLQARRLAVEILAVAGSGTTLQLIDDGLAPMASVSADAGEVAGMPNMAVTAGRDYFIRVNSPIKPAKTPSTQAAESRYKLTVELGDFELGDEREPNDGMESANPVAMVGTAELAGFFGWPRDRDFYRIAAPEVASALDVGLDAVEGVSASLEVVDAGGARLASAKGRRGERLALHNVGVPAANPDLRFFYVAVRSESGQNRGQRYVLHLCLGAAKADAELEPNDDPSHATLVRDGETTGYLPVGDKDYFRYQGEGEREVSIAVTWPSRVRGKIEVLWSPSQSDAAQVVASAEARKPRQTLTLPQIPSHGRPLLVRLGPAKGSGNAIEPYALRISSVAAVTPQTGSTNSPSPLNRD